MILFWKLSKLADLQWRQAEIISLPWQILKLIIDVCSAGWRTKLSISWTVTTSSESLINELSHLSVLSFSCKPFKVFEASCLLVTPRCLCIRSSFRWAWAASAIGSIGTYTSCDEDTLGALVAMFEGSVTGLSVSKAPWLHDNASWLLMLSAEGSLRQLFGAEVKGEARLSSGVAGSGRAGAETGTGRSRLVRLWLDSALSRGESRTCSPAFRWLCPPLAPSSSFFFCSFRFSPPFLRLWLRGTVPTCVYISLELA